MSVSYSTLSTPSGPATGPTKAPRFAEGDRIVFLFSGRRGHNDTLYTVTRRSWLPNPLVEEGYGWYYQAQLTTADGQLTGEPVGPIAEAFVFLAAH